MRSLIFVLLCFVAQSAFAISAKSYIVMGMDGTVIMSHAADEQRPIASITKLVTAARSQELDPDELITITREDIKAGFTPTPLRAGKSYTRAQLMQLALVSSDNVAAIALGRTAEEHAAALPELPENTTIVEASGLDPNNQSTAREVAEMAIALHNTQVAAVSVQEKTEVGKRGSTNPLLNAPGWTFELSKTGFIRAAGGCLVTITKIHDKMVAVVILGARDTRQRWRDLAELRTMMGDEQFTKPTWTSVTKKKKRRR